MRPYIQHRQIVVLALLSLLFFVVFNYLPMLGTVIAFKDYSMSEGVLKSPWVGLAHFQRLFESGDFPRAFRNTLVISGFRLIFGFFAPLTLALMLNEVRMAGLRRGIQSLSCLPYFFSWVILGGVLLMIFGGDGPVNSLLATANQAPVNFLSHDVWFIVILILTGVWQSAGYGAVIYLAALAGIGPQLYEASELDGANRWQQTWHITLPSLRPTIIVLFILSLGGILNAGFDQIYNMYNPMVYDVADIIDTYVLRRMISMDYSLATAAGLLKSVISLVLVVGANGIARRVSGGEHGIW